MLQHRTMGSSLSTNGAASTWTRPQDRYQLTRMAMGLALVSCVAGAWLVFGGASGARADVLVSKWAYFLAVSAILGGALWGAFSPGRRRGESGKEEAPATLHAEFSRFAAVQKYATAALLPSGVYLLIVYSSAFGETLGPWYNGIVGLQGLLWMLLVSMASAGDLVLAESGPGAHDTRRSWLKLITVLSLLSLAVTAVLDVIPYQGLSGPAILAEWVQSAAFGVWFGGAIWGLFVAIPRTSRRLHEAWGGAPSDRFLRLARPGLPVALAAGLLHLYLFLQ